MRAFDSLVIAVAGEQSLGAGNPCLDVSRVDRYRPVKACQRVAEPIEAYERVAAIEMRTRMDRGDRDRGLVVGERRIEPLQLAASVAAVDQGLDMTAALAGRSSGRWLTPISPAGQF